MRLDAVLPDPTALNWCFAPTCLDSRKGNSRHLRRGEPVSLDNPGQHMMACNSIMGTARNRRSEAVEEIVERACMEVGAKSTRQCVVAGQGKKRPDILVTSNLRGIVQTQVVDIAVVDPAQKSYMSVVPLGNERAFKHCRMPKVGVASKRMVTVKRNTYKQLSLPGRDLVHTPFVVEAYGRLSAPANDFIKHLSLLAEQGAEDGEDIDPKAFKRKLYADISRAVRVGNARMLREARLNNAHFQVIHQIKDVRQRPVAAQ
jgi:hypothetical protein